VERVERVERVRGGGEREEVERGEGEDQRTVQLVADLVRCR
jgi:hypothetical protein